MIAITTSKPELKIEVEQKATLLLETFNIVLALGGVTPYDIMRALIRSITYVELEGHEKSRHRIESAAQEHKARKQAGKGRDAALEADAS